MGASQAAVPVEHWRQPNGAQVYFVQSPAIPMLNVRIDFDAGARHDPPRQAGLASAVAVMLDKGVAAHGGLPAVRALDENQLGLAWADLGAQLQINADADRLGFSLRTLTEPKLLAAAVALAARQIGQPSFPAHVWQRERERWRAALQEALTQPASVAMQAYTQAVYGTHPYGQRATAATLGAITVPSMQAFYRTHVAACRARISMVGAVSRMQAQALATQLLAHLPSACPDAQALPAVDEVLPLTQAVALNVPFNAAQAHVLMGQPGYRRRDPDHLALTLGNYILGGGGFASRLSHEVREKRGLSYSVASAFAPGLHAGAFTISLQTRPDQAQQAVAVVRQVLERFVELGPTDEEVQAAKANLVGGFALRLDSNAKLLDNVANIAWNGLPLDYLDTWPAAMEKITAADVRAAFARKLQPARLVTVVLGAKPPVQP